MRSECCKIVAKFRVFGQTSPTLRTQVKKRFKRQKRATYENLLGRIRKISAQVRTCAVNRVHEKFAVEMLLNFWQNFAFWVKKPI